VLVVAGTTEDGQQFRSALERRGHKTSLAMTIAHGVDRAAREMPNLLVLVLPLPGGRARDAIERLRAVDPGLPFVVAGTDADVAGPAEALELGAQEHLGLPLADPAEFLATVGVILGSRRGDRHLRYLHAKDAPPSGWDSVVGQSPAIQRVIDIFKQLSTRTQVGSTPTILLTGETGTGKGYLAKSFHYNGVRRNKPFVEVNCGALPPALMESELFGHERGSFTDAKSGRNGLFETADGGTLFLDEIASLPFDLQAKLLTAIEEKRVRRIGGRHPIQVDVQIIAAAHEDLAQRVKDRIFREDLFHRLNVVAVTMPPLRERGSDVVLLARSFLSSLCSEYGMPARRLSDGALDWLQRYSWPGNVRELRNQIERIVLLENDDTVHVEHFRSEDAVRLRVADGPRERRVRVSLPPNGVSLALIEREILREALARCEGNVSRAARYLSISRQTLIYRMKKHGLGGDAPSD
jgi:DNA-binding NtrC family response regulator